MCGECVPAQSPLCGAWRRGDLPAKRGQQPADRLERRVPLPALEAADLALRDSRELGKRGLGHPRRTPGSDQLHGEGEVGVKGAQGLDGRRAALGSLGVDLGEEVIEVVPMPATMA